MKTGVSRIHFTAADLARTRLTPTLGPIAETIFALGLLGRSRHPLYARWRHGLNRRLRSRTVLTDQLVPPQQQLTLPNDLLCLLDRAEPADDSALRAHDLSRRRLVAGVEEVWRLAIAPSWDGIHAQLEIECASRGRIAMTGGVEQLLATLHPRIVWRPPVLEIPGGPARDIHLGGAGLRLSPSFFLPHHAGIVIRSARACGGTVLVFSAAPDAPQSIGLGDEPDNRVHALGALVGRTRAAALRELTVARTTGQLAERLGISSAGASQHAAVLRDSGLITSRRLRNTVLHTATPLGMALLGAKLRRHLNVRECRPAEAG
jgi:DNA-binding transcriptional ArsR family regulator